jgi:hypothetical protein
VGLVLLPGLLVDGVQVLQEVRLVLQIEEPALGLGPGVVGGVGREGPLGLGPGNLFITGSRRDTNIQGLFTRERGKAP